MNKIKARAWIIILVLFVALVLIFSFFSLKKAPPAPSPSPVGASYKELAPGASTRADLERVLGPVIDQTEEGLLLFKSTNPNLPHEVVMSEDTVAFIKEAVTAQDKKTSDEITQKYGAAPYVLYGPGSMSGFNLYVYPDKGIAYLGHSKEAVLLEVWYFQPTSIDNFKSRWAKEYSENISPIQ